MSVNLTRHTITAAIHPELLRKLNTALHPINFNEESTLYHMGYEQAKADFKVILNHHLNEP